MKQAIEKWGILCTRHFFKGIIDYLRMIDFYDQKNTVYFNSILFFHCNIDLYSTFSEIKSVRLKHKIVRYLFFFFWRGWEELREWELRYSSYPNNGVARKLSNVIMRRKANFHNAKRIRRNGILVYLECENANG